MVFCEVEGSDEYKTVRELADDVLNGFKEIDRVQIYEAESKPEQYQLVFKTK